MFLCDDCHDRDCPGMWIEQFGGSYGPCESCHKRANCADCHGYRQRKPSDEARDGDR